MMNFIRELNMQYADENQACESPCGYSPLANMPDYKSFKFIDDAKVMTGLKESTSTCVPEFGRQKEDNTGGTRSSMSYEDTSSSEVEGSSGRKKIYIEKKVVDSFMPEMVGFFDDSSRHFFIDIFRDIESRCEETCSVENCDLDQSSTCSVTASDVESEPKTCTQNDCNLTECDKASETTTHEEPREQQEAVAAVDSSETIRPEDQLVSEILIRNFEKMRFKNPEADLLSHYQETEQLDRDCNKSEASDESDEGDSASSTITNAEESTYQENLTTGEAPSWDQSSSDEQGHEILASQTKDNERRPIEVLEHLPYCGSLSFRLSIGASSSSSFSFPILPSEWQGTPVRMPRANRRHLQRHICWRKNLLCCKF